MDISRRRNSRIACANPADKAEDSLNCPRLAAAVPSVEVYPIEQGRVKGIRDPGSKLQVAGMGKAAPGGGLPLPRKGEASLLEFGQSPNSKSRA